MCSCGDFLEIYKIDKTFRVKTPESIDPQRTNPKALWTASPQSDIGTSNPIVARVLLQSHEILKAASFETTVDKEAVTVHLHSCKEALLACEITAIRINSRIDIIIEKVNNVGLAHDCNGRGLNPFPQVQELDVDCGTFLIQANRAIKLICELPKFFLSLDKKDSNFEHLGKTLETILDEKSPLIQFVKDNQNHIKYLIELRNFHEHPNSRKTVIDNFKLMPDSTIMVPRWYLSDGEPHSIKEELIAVIAYLRDVAELMLIHLVMQTISKSFPFVIESIPEHKIDLTNPIRYRLSLDVSKMNFPE